jgi:hypothetical protein
LIDCSTELVKKFFLMAGDTLIPFLRFPRVGERTPGKERQVKIKKGPIEISPQQN